MLGVGLAVATLGLVVGCGKSGQSASSRGRTADGKIEVVASTDIYGSLVRAVGGDRVAVDTILHNPSVDPHEYQSTPADAVAVGHAALVVVNGAGYDRFLSELARGKGGSRPAIVDAAKVSGLPEADTAGDESSPPFNEHLWYSLRTIRRVIAAIGQALSTADRPGAPTYAAAAAAAQGRLDALVAQVEVVRQKAGGAKVAVTEPVPIYLLEAMGLDDLTPGAFSLAIEEGHDPSPAALKEVLDLLRAKKVRLLAYNTQAETALTRQVSVEAGKAGVPVVRVYETLPAGETDYLAWMAGQIHELAVAVGAG